VVKTSYIGKVSFNRLIALATSVVGLLLVTCLCGCGKNDARVYRIPKEQAKPAAANLPAGWQPAPLGQMRFASFQVNGENGKKVDISVIPLPGEAGNDLANVNRWRGQVNLPPVTEGELAQLAEPVQIGGEPAKLFDQAGEADKTRIVGAILRKEGTAWFFKMTGDDALVAKQKPAFIEYLKSFDFAKPQAATEMTQTELPPSHPPIGDGSGASPAQAPTVTANAEKPEWKVPAGWKETAAGPFLVAKFVIDGGSAAVNVSMSAGKGGGLAANVNRWRSQLSLEPSSEEEISKGAQTVDIASGKATFIEMSGTDAKTGEKARIVGAIVPRKESTWFFKLMGPEQLVQQHKDDFQKFVETAKCPE
jgi:hypothetical protein